LFTNLDSIDFFGNEVETIRTFEIESQLSINIVSDITIIPNIQWEKERNVKRVSLIEYLPKNTCIWAGDLDLIFKKTDEVYDKADISDSSDPTLHKNDVIENSSSLKKNFEALNKVEFGKLNQAKTIRSWSFNTSPQPLFSKNCRRY
jgi:transcription-repair coupling factor (superfamily II helicase)